MTNREMLIACLQAGNDEEIQWTATAYIACPYIRDEDCENPHKYGTSSFQVYCDEVCKMEWLNKNW